MARKFHCRKARSSSRRTLAAGRWAKDVAVIDGQFGAYLRCLGEAPITVEQYQRKLICVAAWLREHLSHPSLNEFTRSQVPGLLTRILPHRSPVTRVKYRHALFHWLRFQGRYMEPIREGWGPWLSDHLQFLRTHQGVSRSTLELNEANTKAFLKWQFGTGRAQWSQVRPSDIWDFARRHVRGVKPSTAKSYLGYVRRFLKFVHLRGACGPELAAAIPKVAVSRPPSRPAILSEQQRSKLLNSFKRTSPEGERNYAMTLCMLDLGLRCSEVIGLRLGDIDWRRRWLNVRMSKTGRGRRLPLPDHVRGAMLEYLKTARPQNTPFDHFFVRHPYHRGFPLTRSAVKGMIRKAYRRCGFPSHWSGTHRLRHTFASRLHQRGVDMKPIADLLGHRQLDSTNLYTQLDLEALRQVAQPWPR